MSGPQLREVFDNIRIPAYEPTKLDALKFRSALNDVNRVYLNCFPVPNQDKSEVWIQKRSGVQTPQQGFGLTSLSATIGSVNCNAMYNLAITQLNDNFVAAIYDYTNSRIRIVVYKPVGNSAYVIGTLTGTSATDEIFLTELNIGGTPYIGIVYHNQDSTNSRAYYSAYSSGAGTFGSITQITDADFPTQVATPDHLIGPMIQMNGTTYVLAKSGKIYGSDLNSITSWNALNVIQAIQYPDNAIGLCRFKHFIVAFGGDSIEFFNDAGNAAPASPLQRTDQGFIKMGCWHPRSFVNIDDKLYWLARSSTGTNGLWVLDGSISPKKITGPAEDAILSEIGGVMNTYGPHIGRVWPFFCNGRKHLVIGSTTTYPGLLANGTYTGDTNSIAVSDITGGQLCMTLDDGEFWTFQSPIGAANKWFFPLFASNYEAYSTSGTAGISPSDQYMPGALIGISYQTTTTGLNIYQMPGIISTSTGQDLSSNYATGFQLSSKDFGNLKQKRIHTVSIVQRGFTSSTTACHIWLLWSKNDNATVGGSDLTTTKQGEQSLLIPVTNNRIYFRRLGMARSWTFGIVCKNDGLWAIKDIELDISQGVH